MQKKVFVILAALMIIAMVLTACKPAATPTAEPTTPPAATEAPKATEAPAPTAEPTVDPATLEPYAGVDPTGVTINFWHNQTKAKEEALKAIVDEFNATNEWKITVNAEYQGNYSEIYNKMVPVLNTPDVPDIVVAYQNNAASYQLAGALVDMNNFVNSTKWGLSADEQKDFFPGFFAQDVNPAFDNQRLGFPPNRSAEVMYYNATWLKELGYDAVPTTPELFVEAACKAAKTPFTGATAEGSTGFELSMDASRLASWAFAFGGDVYDYDTNQFVYNSEPVVKAAEMIQKLYTDGCAKQVVEAYGDQTDFTNGTLLFYIGSSSGLTYVQSGIAEGAKFDWSVAALPHTTADPKINVYGASVSVPKSTPERELAAWLFIKFYTNAESQAKWAAASTYFPVRASVADGMTEYFTANPAYKAGFDLLQYGTFEPPVPGYDPIRTEVNSALAAIIEGADVKTTLEDLNTKANAILAENLAQIKK